jgi:hypothetical protein
LRIANIYENHREENDQELAGTFHFNSCDICRICTINLSIINHTNNYSLAPTPSL